MIKIIKKIFGTKYERQAKKLWPTVKRIKQIEESLQSEPDEALIQRTTAWKERLGAIEDTAELENTMNEILPEAFAVVKNACRRMMNKEIIVRGHTMKWDMIPFDVQLVGAIALHEGKIAEMATGEGKTLVATMPVYLNALSGRGVHIITVNDYLAARDSEWMGAIYKFLGLTVGCIEHDQSPHVRREQYKCDVTYGTNAEFGFDYLRDNGMASRAEDQVQRGHAYAIIDEVDSILIDEARTPLIISGPAVVNADNTIFAKYKPSVESIVRAQQRLCKEYVEKSEELLSKIKNGAPNPEELQRELGLTLFKIKQGHPKSPNLLRLLEEPENMRYMNQAELELHADQSKKALYGQKEDLYFAIDEKGHDADLTEKGRAFLSPDDSEAFVLPDLTEAFHEIDSSSEEDVKKRMEAKSRVQSEFEAKAERIHCISQLLKAFCLYERDVEYVIQDNKVIIVDEHTGRLMTGRRWSDGLHQAVEAKEGVEIERETQTLATVTIQNYFRMYDKLAGMTGTAETEANEFLDIYDLDVMVIPTNKPVQRHDYNDSVYKTKREKFNAVLKEIIEIHNQGRPILVGTISVETSELISRMLKRSGIVHSVLNAKFHQQEAEIISRAGQRGAVTIATNMAGRGTDIKLGPGIAEAGGLHVMATERHESRRIDRQLRGRCARQGDPGSSHFFISLEDDLMRLFGSDRIVKVMERVGLEEGQELEHPLLNRSIQTAQKRVEQHNFQMRKRTLEYDDVMNKQRGVIYGFRNEIIHTPDVRDRLMDIMEEVVIQKVEQYTSTDKEPSDWKIRQLADWVNLNFPIGITEAEITNYTKDASETPVPNSIFDGLNPAQFAVCTEISNRVREAYELKAKYENAEAIQAVERYTILSAIDKLWQEHLYFMDSLRNAIGLRAYGQRDPVIEYKAEAFKTFEDLMLNIKTEICHNIFRSASSLMAFEKFLYNLSQRNAVHQSSSAFGNKAAAARQAQSNPSDMVSEAAEKNTKARPVRSGPKVGRNDPCPCGSGKKYKQCCGK